MNAVSALTALASFAGGATIAALLQERRVRRSERDDTYGMLTRPGGLARLNRMRGPVDIVFVDIDGMHDLNAQLGYDQVNARIRQAFRIRQSDALIICRWFSGDEILVVTRPGDGAGLSDRLLARMRDCGLSATVCVSRGAGYTQAIATAAAHVQQAKQSGRRGQVVRP